MSLNNELLPEKQNTRKVICVLAVICYLFALVFAFATGTENIQRLISCLILAITSIQVINSNLIMNTNFKIILSAAASLLPAVIAVLTF